MRDTPSADATAVDTVVQLRRYRCVRCGAVVLVGPRGVLSRRRFTAFAIVLALVAWIGGKRAREVRATFSSVPFVPFSHVTWPALLRWVDAITTHRLFPSVRGSPPGWTRRQQAERAVSTIRAMAPPSARTTVAHEAFAGAFFAALAA